MGGNEGFCIPVEADIEHWEQRNGVALQQENIIFVPQFALHDTASSIDEDILILRIEKVNQPAVGMLL